MGRLKGRYDLQSRPESKADFAPLNSTAIYEGSNTAEFFTMAKSASGYVVNEPTAMRVSAVYACVEKLSVISTLPKHIYKKTDKGRERVDHKYWEFLNTEPTPAWTAQSFWERTITSFLLRQDGIVEILRPGKLSSDIIGLKPLNRESIYITQIDGRLKYRITPINGATYVKDQDDILHFPGFGFNGLNGMSVIQYAARNGIGIALAADDYSAEFFANGQRPDFVMQSPGTLKPEQIKNIKDQFEERHSGPTNHHKPLILEGGMSINPLTMSAEDTQLIETRKFQVIDICMAFGVPPQLIGAQESTAGWAGSSLEQLNLGFVKYGLRPHIQRITQEINRKLFKNAPYFMEMNLDAFLEADQKTQAEYFAKALGGPGSQGYMSVNEVRRLKNLPADDSENEYDTVIKSGTAQTTNTGAQNDPKNP